MKFRAHETFTLRKGWLHKAIKNIEKNPRLFSDKNINPMDELGVGSNMVKAIRYWIQATGIAEEVVSSSRSMKLTSIGELIWTNDNYFEEYETWFLLHYLLASNKDYATTWYYMFNEYTSHDISREDFNYFINTYLLQEQVEQLPSDRVLKDDFDCFIKTYYDSKEQTDPESNFICPFTELGLLKKNEEKLFVKSTPKKNSIHPLIILAVIINESNKSDNPKEIPLSDLEQANCNIGKIFNLDTISISEYLDRLQTAEYIKVIRTAGLDYLQLKTDLTFYDCIEKCYQSIK